MAVNLSPAARAALERIDGPRPTRAAAPGRAGGPDRTGATPGPARTGNVGGTSGPDFGDVLVDAMRKAGDAERDAEKAAKDFAEGKAGIHETILAQERAGISVRYAVTVKNKALEAYRELMNTQV